MELIHTLYEPQGGGPHPAILTLHGRGANAFDLLGLAPHLAGGKFLLLCPQGPLVTPIGPGVAGYSWYPLGGAASSDPDALIAARGTLRRFLDQALQRYPIDEKKLVAMGFSQGGVMAYALALTMPNRFAGLVALSSWLPEAAIQQIGLADCRLLPVLVQHGTRDRLIEVNRARDAVEQLRSRRVPVVYREYDMDHEITPRSLSDLSAWLEQRILSPVVPG